MALTPLDLLSNDPKRLGFDPIALQEKYNLERDRRIRPDGDRQYVNVEGDLDADERDPYAEYIQREPIETTAEVVITGGGYAGLLAGAYLRKAGVTDIRVIDVAGDFGGTWYWNRYPNCQCDTESYMYMPMLEETGTMPSRNYAYAPEIFAHCRSMAEKFDLYRGALFHTEVTSAVWDDNSATWLIRTDRGDRIRARHFIMAGGWLTKPKLPRLPGISRFQGHMFHTSRWDYAYTGGDHEGNLVGLKDKVVGIIGTGATAIQCVVPLGECAKELFVFQRTPSAIGVRGNRLTEPDWASQLSSGWQRRRSQQFVAALEGYDYDEEFPGDGWIDLLSYNQKVIRDLRASGHDLSPTDLAQLTANADFEKMNAIRQRVDEIVKDPAKAEILKPWYRPLCKRPCFHDEYLDTFNRESVHVVDAGNGGVQSLTERGLMVDGKEYELDCIIFATGFEVVSDWKRRVPFDVVGRDGMTLAHKWAGGYRTHFGISVSGFPNFYLVTHTQAPLPQNIPTLLEEMALHVAYIISEGRARGADAIESTLDGEQSWQDEIYATRKDADRFYSECTPGYYNAEGKISEHGSFYGNLYGGGTIKYFEILRAWRESGKLDGIELRHATEKTEAA